MDSVTVVLPHQLRQEAGGVRSVTSNATTVREMLNELDSRFPGMKFRFCQETGELRPFVNVFVGSENVRYLDGLDSRLRSGDVVHIIHSVAGGAQTYTDSRTPEESR